MAVIEGTRAGKTYVGEYDFAVDGGGTGTITLRSESGPLPSGAIVQGGEIDVTTAVLSATGTVALQLNTAADLLAATAQAGLTVGIKAIIPVFTAATMVKATAVRSPAMVIATAALTAGKFRLILFYI